MISPTLLDQFAADPDAITNERIRALRYALEELLVAAALPFSSQHVVPRVGSFTEMAAEAIGQFWSLCKTPPPADVVAVDLRLLHLQTATRCALAADARTDEDELVSELLAYCDRDDLDQQPPQFITETVHRGVAALCIRELDTDDLRTRLAFAAQRAVHTFANLAAIVSREWTIAAPKPTRRPPAAPDTDLPHRARTALALVAAAAVALTALQAMLLELTYHLNARGLIPRPR